MKNFNDWEELFASDPQFKKLKVISRDENGRPTSVYCLIGLGLFMTDRESLSHVSYKKTPEGDDLYILHSMQHPDYPEDGDAIRVQWYSVAKLTPTEDGKGVHVTEFSNFDAMGYIPTSMMNMTMSSSTK